MPRPYKSEAMFAPRSRRGGHMGPPLRSEGAFTNAQLAGG